MVEKPYTDLPVKEQLQYLEVVLGLGEITIVDLGIAAYCGDSASIALLRREKIFVLGHYEPCSCKYHLQDWFRRIPTIRLSADLTNQAFLTVANLVTSLPSLTIKVIDAISQTREVLESDQTEAKKKRALQVLLMNQMFSLIDAARPFAVFEKDPSPETVLKGIERFHLRVKKSISKTIINSVLQNRKMDEELISSLLIKIQT